MISLKDCEHRRLYKLNARNLRLGVFDAEKRRFLGIREECGSRFVDAENHRETGPMFGTARPLEPLPEHLPDEIDLCAYYPWSVCGDCGDRIEYRQWEPGKAENEYPGRWVHLSPGNCRTSDRAYAYINEKLYTWLEEKERQYGNGPTVAGS